MLLITALDLFDVETLTVSDWALREGIVLDAVRTHDPDDWSDDPRALRRAAVANLARRCNSDERHTAHVTRLALRLFDETQSLHGLGPEDREMLEFASMLHDIGQHVSRKGHHRHAAYLVENAQLRGFEPSEIDFLATLVRHHRRGDPKPSEARFAALSADDRVRVRKLAALLRVADGLDRGRRGVVDDVRADIGADLVILRLRVHGDAELALWGRASPARPVRAGVRPRNRVRGRRPHRTSEKRGRHEICLIARNSLLSERAELGGHRSRH